MRLVHRPRQASDADGLEDSAEQQWRVRHARPLVAQKGAHVHTEADARHKAEELQAGLFSLVILDAHEERVAKVEHGEHADARAAFNVEQQPHVSGGQERPWYHGLLPGKPLGQVAPRFQQPLPVEKGDEKDEADGEGDNDGRGIPRIGGAAPSEAKNYKAKARDKEDLAAKVNGLYARQQLCAPARLVGFVEFGNRLGTEEVLAQ